MCRADPEVALFVCVAEGSTVSAKIFMRSSFRDCATVKPDSCDRWKEYGPNGVIPSFVRAYLVKKEIAQVGALQVMNCGVFLLPGAIEPTFTKFFEGFSNRKILVRSLMISEELSSRRLGNPPYSPTHN